MGFHFLIDIWYLWVMLSLHNDTSFERFWVCLLAWFKFPSIKITKILKLGLRGLENNCIIKWGNFCHMARCNAYITVSWPGVNSLLLLICFNWCHQVPYLHSLPDSFYKYKSSFGCQPFVETKKQLCLVKMWQLL